MLLKNFWKILYLSFYSRQLYLTVSGVWQHWGMKYLLNLAIVLTVLTNGIFFINLYRFNFNEPSIIKLLDQVPKFTVTNNEAKANDESIKYPVRIKSENSDNRDVLIIDLSTSEADQYKQNVVVLTKNKIAFNFIDNPSFDISYNDLFGTNNKVQVNTESIITTLELLRKKTLGVLLILGIPLGSLIMFIALFIKAIFYAFVANIFLRFSHRDWGIKKLTRLAIVSNTPALIVSVLFTTMFFEYSLTPAAQFFVAGIFMLYFAFAIINSNNQYKTRFYDD